MTTDLTPARVHFDDTDPDHDGFWIQLAPDGSMYIDEESHHGMIESGVIDATDPSAPITIDGQPYREITTWELNPDEIITDHNEEGDWVKCLCGNDPAGDGFYTSTRQGDYVTANKLAAAWDGESITCLSCGRVINTRSWLVSATAPAGFAERYAADEAAEWAARKETS